MKPNLADYDAARAGFTWEGARRLLDGLPGGRGLNIAHETVDRHVLGPRAGHVALRWLGAGGDTWNLTYADLAALTNRFANVLERLGVSKGDRVFTLTGRIPDLYVAALGTLKHRAVLAPLFAAFGPEPIQTRLAIGDAKVLVTTEALYRQKVQALRPRLPTLEHVLLVRPPGAHTSVPNTRDLHTLLDAASDHYEIGPTAPEDPALLHFTSGTTGTPKGAVHVHEAVVAHHATGRLALDLHPSDVFWCTADPGWVTGTSYGIIAPLCAGATLLCDEAEIDPERWYGLLESERVSVWYTAPTAVRMLMRYGSEAARAHRYPKLRFVASVGEPLHAEGVVWGQEVLGHPIHDTWWQTETGAIMISNFASMEIRPGSMGRPVPGIEAAIVRVPDSGPVEVVGTPGEEGQIAIRAGWPSMFRGYLNEKARYEACFRDGWYLSGDLARKDADGWFWFLGRADDVIKSSGHLIGPFEVESALLEHPSVAEAAAIGKPDPVAGEIVKAFVSLEPGHAGDEDLRLELLALARKRLGATVAPKEIAFVDEVPHTRSGKIMRRLLRARELGLPEGDLSTLERPR